MIVTHRENGRVKRNSIMDMTNKHISQQFIECPRMKKTILRLHRYTVHAAKSIVKLSVYRHLL